MNIKLLMIIYFSYLYGFFELFMGIRQRLKRKEAVVKSGDKLSIWILFLFIGLGYFLSFRIGFTSFGRIYYWNTLFTIGSVVVIAGLFIRILSILTLKQYFTYTVTSIDSHELIESGLYKHVRHPGYLGQLIIFIGISIALSNWLSMISMMILVLIGYLNRIRVEERFLIEEMGEKYIAYKKRTKKLIPKLY